MAEENKGEKPKAKKYKFLVDYPVGLNKEGKPQKVYKKGQSYPLDAGVANYLKSKSII